MIPAQHRKWAQALFHIYIMRLMRKHFHAFHLMGQAPVLPLDHTLVILPNHSSWWDGFFIHLLNQQLWQRRPFLMMLEEQLAQHRFFTKLGVFSVKTEGFAAVKGTLAYTRHILHTEPPDKTFLCLFPQGELRPGHIRPLGYKPGILWLLSKASAPVALVQLAIRVEYLLEQRADVYFEFGPVQLYNGNLPELNNLETAHGDLLDRLGNRVIDAELGSNLLQGKSSVSARWQHFRRIWNRRKP